jgi:hypothetical protein
MTDQPRTWSIDAAAAELGRDRRTVAAACRELEPAEIVGGKRRFHLAAIVEALGARAALRGPSPALEAAQARKLAAEAELAEMRLARARAAVVPVADFAPIWEETRSAIRARLLAIPGAVAPAVAAETREGQCAALLREAIHGALADLAAAPVEEIEGAN